MRHGPRLGQHILRKNSRQLVFANHHLHIDAKVIRRAEHLDHAPHCCSRFRRPARDLHIHHQAFQIFVGGCCCFAAQHPVRRGSLFDLRNLQPIGNQNRLRHALVKWHNRIPMRPLRPRIMKDTHHRRIAPLQHTRDAPHPPPIGFGRFQLHQHLVTLHGAVDLVGRNKYIVVTSGLPRIGPDKTIAVAMQIEPPRNQILAPANRLRNAPVLAVQLGQRAVCRHPRQLLQQQPPLSPAAKAQLAHQLLVSGLAARRARNPRRQFLVRHSFEANSRRLSFASEGNPATAKSKNQVNDSAILQEE